MKALISGIGWVTVAGMGRMRESSSFAMDAGDLPEITRQAVFDKPDRRFGRMDDFSKLGLAAIAFALKDAGLDLWQKKRPIGLIASTVYGCLATDSNYFDTVIPQDGAFASPHLFAYTLPNTFLGEAAIRFGLTGTGFVINEQKVSGLSPIQMALESLCWGEEEIMLTGVVDLTGPEGFPASEKSLPGALFVVLEKNARSGFPPFGEVRLDDGTLLFGEDPVENLPELVGACLNSLDPIEVKSIK